MRVKFDTRKLTKELNNIVDYATGFLDGAQQGKSQLLDNIGLELKLAVEQYIDSTARVNPAELHHVYEWYQTGSPEARLFDIDYVITGGGLSMNATLSQSRSVKDGSRVPFSSKARIMEGGVSVTVSPRNSPVLAFEENGETVFTRKPVTINSPGGEQAAGGFERAFKEFFLSYLSQAMMFSSGMMFNLQNPVDFKRNLSAGKTGGRSVGVAAGRKWISRSAV